jgi:hypothetical protein
MPLNNAGSFSGANYLSIANYTGNDSSDFSIAAWAYLNTSQTSRVFLSNYQSTGSKGWAPGISDSTNNQMKFYLGSNTLFQGSFLSVQVWHFAVFTWDGTTARVYLDGNRVADNTLASGVSYGAVPASNYIGTLDGTNQRLNGRLSGVGYWSRALSSDEVAILYNRGAGLLYSEMGGGVQSGLVSYQDFETSGNLGLDTAGTNHYTNNGAVTQAAGPAQRNLYRRTVPFPPRPAPGRFAVQPLWYKGLIAAIVPDDMAATVKDYSVTNAPAVVSGSGVTKGRCEWGPCWNWNGAVQTGLRTGASPGIGATELTVSALVRCTSNRNTNTGSAGIRNLVSLSANTTAFILRYFTEDYSSNPGLIGFIVGSSNECFTNEPPSMLQDWHLFTGRFQGAGGTGNLALFYGGVKVATGTNGLSSVPDPGGSTPFSDLWIGSTATINEDGRTWSGDVAAVYVWSRMLSDQEVQLLADDPLAPVRPPKTQVLWGTPGILTPSALVLEETGLWYSAPGSWG